MPAIAAQVEPEEATRIVLGRVPAVDDVSVRRLYHPYAGIGYCVDRTTFGQLQPLRVHTMVDLRNGAPAICEPWPELEQDVDDEILGPSPILDADAARRQSRHCVLRALLKRRFALRQPTLTEVDYLSPLYKPNWIIDLRMKDSDRPVRVLVDGLNGGYHRVALPNTNGDRDCAPVSNRSSG